MERGWGVRGGREEFFWGVNLQKYELIGMGVGVERRERCGALQIQFKLMASRVLLDNILVRNNPALFQDAIELDITFSTLQPLTHPLEWRILYVGSAQNEDCDQILDEFEIGSISQKATMNFTVSCSPPDHTKIPFDELICVTALILTVTYRGQEFIRVGYYVHNALLEEMQDVPFHEANLAKIIKGTKRTILTDKPRVTKFRIEWEEANLMKEETNPFKNGESNSLHAYSAPEHLHSPQPHSENAHNSNVIQTECNFRLSPPTLPQEEDISQSLLKSEPNPSAGTVEYVGE